MGYVVKKDYFTDEISQDKSDGQEILAILGRISRQKDANFAKQKSLSIEASTT